MQSIPKLIVLGVDGMDPAFVERHWDALPNLKQLRDQGHFSRLATTTPPQSPVAWSTFITGLPPSAHGIYDFVHRNPVTLQPFSSLSRNEEPRFHVPIGPFDLPLSPSRVASLRQGTPFWQLLVRQGIPATIMRMPANYPPAPYGHAISGMGVPDLSGTLGTFSFFTDDPGEYPHSVVGGRIIKVFRANGRVVLPLEGPPNSLRKKREAVLSEIVLDIDPARPVVRLSAGGIFTVLREGEWSGWLSTDFPLIHHAVTVRGTFRVYVKQLHPRLSIYVSAVNTDPLSPELPVSFPETFGREVAIETGRYSTLGIPEDTSALRQQVFTLNEFVSQARLIFNEEHRLLLYSLRHLDGGFLFFYLSSVDQNSHVLWSRHEPELLSVYQAVDTTVGEIRRLQPQAELVIMSDHGFTTFDRAVHLNTWLQHRGFLAVSQPPGEQNTLENADWSSTEAYAIGLNGLYLNMKGREGHGIIEPGSQRSALLANLKQQLTSWRDPLNGRQIIEVADENPVSANNAAIAPDVIVGYASGYRASWQTGLGGVPDSEVEDNKDAWIGDHCVNPANVPGVLFTSRRELPVPNRLEDVTRFVLQRFGVN
ncbi:MAG: type phosphodiesterase/nucleotide pyrophosphatase [Bryobacterales bacterium]|nr:type phosphodiesterase/nucleotide pyrophosphatase [Bryobacterales bacterium]